MNAPKIADAEAFALARRWAAGEMKEPSEALLAWAVADGMRGFLKLDDALGDKVDAFYEAMKRHRFETYKAAHPRWYDEREGIEEALALNLAGLDELREARRASHERLTDWALFGRYWLDCAGNVLVAENKNDRLPRIAARSSGGDLGLGMCSLYRIARAEDVCPRCGRGWVLRTAHDVTYVDSQPYHRECKEYEVHEHVRKNFVRTVGNVWPGRPLRAVPNRYGSASWRGPWFVLETQDLGRVTIGWRKRVIQISWERGPDGREVFASEDVTKGPNLVHAYGYDAAESYLMRLRIAARQKETNS